MLGVDPRRFGDYATRAYLVKKNEKAYANVFTVHYPDEERPAARPLRTAPCHDRLKALGAVFGWERANWFAPEGVEAVDDWSFRRSRWFEPVDRECRNVAANEPPRESRGVICFESGGHRRLIQSMVVVRLERSRRHMAEGSGGATTGVGPAEPGRLPATLPGRRARGSPIRAVAGDRPGRGLR